MNTIQYCKAAQITPARFSSTVPPTHRGQGTQNCPGFLPFPRPRTTEIFVFVFRRNKKTDGKGKKKRRLFFSLTVPRAGKPLKHLEPALGRIDKRDGKSSEF
jgi:hypothetical protein